ncbi:SDR family NAD(P)-dependent oxidoreductase [Phenylobacterium sp. LjRoot219]|uniref:SDR family NAD(P)-dependent oxidoreductase n=1 Tax=Phenylobacterium sp. LjRoot219 TaxID=3342283 RepID=UPI003ECCFCF7
MAICIDLEGRVVLLCGAARGGISGATARRLAATGATVVAVDQAQEILDLTIADVEAAGGRCHGVVANLMDAAQTDPLVATVVGRFGRLDGVVNVAGGTKAEEWIPLEQTSTEMFRDTLNLNLEYVFRICRDAAASMIRRDAPGSIVNVGSVSSIAAAPFHGPYGAAKSGIAALTRTMAFEWGKYGIRANTVQPGAVATDRVMNRPSTPHAGAALAGANAPSIVWTTPDELANTIVFLLSDLASGISGQTISVDSALSTKFCAGSRPFEINKRNPQV